MKIILLSKIKKLGNIGNLITVKSGYARNFLIPTGKAMVANQNNINSFEAQRLKLVEEYTSKLEIAKERAKKIQDIKSITINSKSGKEGKIFGSIGIRHIIKELSMFGLKVHKKEIQLINGIIRHIGDYEVIFQPHPNIHEKFIVHVISTIL